MPTTHRLTPGVPVKLKDVTTRGKDLHPDRDDAEREFKELRDELIELQNKFYADGTKKLLVVFQAIDAGGKDGTIRKVFRGVNPQGCRVWSFKTPTAAELAHDFLWRIHQRVPADGMIGVFNRSHYEDVLVVRVNQLAPEEIWRPRYEQINHFEALLAANRTTVLKFYLHISKEEQKERFQARIDEPEKRWKFSREDLAKRKQWDAYQLAYEEMLYRCTTHHAPWYVIPADQKWYRNLAIARVLVDAMHRCHSQYPSPEENLDQVHID